MEARTISYGDIGWAVNHMRLGHKMRRAGWPAGLYVALDTSQGEQGLPGILKLFGSAVVQGTLYESAPADLLNTDWALFEPTLPGEYHA